jgi:leucyl aminopeptidase
MEFSVKSGSPEKQRSACVVVGVLSPAASLRLPNSWTRSATATSSSLLRVATWKETGPDAAAASSTGRAQRARTAGRVRQERELDERQYKQINQTITTLNETGSMEAVWP